MARFGARSPSSKLGERLAGPEEPEASELITEILRREGVEVHTGVADRARRAVGATGAQPSHLADGTALAAERMLVATGRRSDLAAPRRGRARPRRGGPRPPGRRPHAGRARACGRSATSPARGVHPRRHVPGPPLCGRHPRAPRPDADYRALPRVTFTDPEIGSVGMTEARPRRRGRRRASCCSEPIADSARGWIHRGEGLVKLVGTGRRAGRRHLHGPVRRRGARAC